MRRDTFPGFDEPVDNEADPQDQLRAGLNPESALPVEDGIEPSLDD